jgi:hypothetical protein
MTNPQYRYFRQYRQNKKDLMEITTAWKQASGYYPSVHQLGQFLNECLQYPVFNINENVEVGQNEITWFADQLTALMEDVVDAQGNPIDPNARSAQNPYGKGKPFDASVLPPWKPKTIKWSETSQDAYGGPPDNRRWQEMQDTIHGFRQEAARRGFRMPDTMLDALERIHASKPGERGKAARQAFEDMMGNLTKGRIEVVRSRPLYVWEKGKQIPNPEIPNHPDAPRKSTPKAKPGSVKPSVRPLIPGIPAIPGGWKGAAAAAAVLGGLGYLVKNAMGDEGNTGKTYEPQGYMPPVPTDVPPSPSKKPEKTDTNPS